jgi:class 3 adenylate cyclase
MPCSSCLEPLSGRIDASYAVGDLLRGPRTGDPVRGRAQGGVGGIGVGIRAGLHTGELELRGDDVGGLAVHLAARVMAAAQPGGILVSRTVRDLAAGADVTLEDRGMHLLKGVDGDWQLHAVARP